MFQPPLTDDELKYACCSRRCSGAESEAGMYGTVSSTTVPREGDPNLLILEPEVDEEKEFDREWVLDEEGREGGSRGEEGEELE